MRALIFNPTTLGLFTVCITPRVRVFQTLSAGYIDAPAGGDK